MTSSIEPDLPTLSVCLDRVFVVHDWRCMNSFKSDKAEHGKLSKHGEFINDVIARTNAGIDLRGKVLTQLRILPEALVEFKVEGINTLHLNMYWKRPKQCAKLRIIHDGFAFRDIHAKVQAVRFHV